MSLNKRFLHYMVFNASSALLSFFVTLFLAKHLTPIEFGYIGLFQSISIFLIPLMTFGIGSLVSVYSVKYTSIKYDQFKVRYFSFIIRNYLFTFAIASLSIILFGYFQLTAILVLYAFFLVLNSIHQSELIVSGDSYKFGIVVLFQSLLSLFLTLLFISLFEMKWEGRLLAILLAEIITLGVRIKYFDFTVLMKIVRLNNRILKKYYLLGLPVMISVVVTWFFNGFDKFFLNHYFTLHEVGLYTLAANFTMLIMLINSSVANALQPRYFQILKEKKGKSYIVQVYWIYFLTSILLISITIVLFKKFIFIFIPQSYSGIENIFAYSVLGVTFQGLYYTVGPIFDYYKMNYSKMQILILASIIAITATFLLKNIFGYLSPAVGTMIGFATLSFVSYGVIMYKLKIDKVV